MSMTAQSRDLADRKTIKDFSAIVQTIERLRLLLILTVVDIRAVGPGVWTGWKGQLLRTLYYETEPYLLGGHSQLSRGQRTLAARAELEARLASWPEDERRRALERHYDPYWLRVDLPEKLAHAELLRQRQGRPASASPPFRHTRLRGGHRDHGGGAGPSAPLSTLAGACTAAGANIVDAQIFTTTDGLALDTIMVTGSSPTTTTRFGAPNASRG